MTGEYIGMALPNDIACPACGHAMTIRVESEYQHFGTHTVSYECHNCGHAEVVDISAKVDADEH